MGESGRNDPGALNSAVYLDRDGVINSVELKDGRPHPPGSLKSFSFLPGVGDAVAALSNGGYKIIVVTNQPDVATGRQEQSVVDEMHQKIRASMPVDDIKVCFHIDEDGCECRKPKPGMLLEAASEWSIDLDVSFMVGDRWRDVAAGKAAGCRTILIQSNYSERQADNPDSVVGSLLEASNLILSGNV